MNDASISGFVSAANRPGTTNALVGHITAYSHPSPWTSFTTSFAVARAYALSGPNGIASRGNPGFVYEVDLAASPVAIPILNPLEELSRTQLAHQHDGDQSLVGGLAQNVNYIKLVHQPGGTMVAATVTQVLRALIYALRDGEVLIDRVPSGCVIMRHSVY